MDNESKNDNASEVANTVGEPSAKITVRPRLADKIRSELNLEKWPAIWQPAKSKNKPALRVMQREFTAKDGNRISSRVEVGYTHLGTLSTEEQKMLYVLIKLWEEDGKPSTQVFFSSRALARMLKKKGWGTNVIEAITKSLRKLRTIPIEWINSYRDQTREGTVVVDRRPLTLLGDLRIIERRQDGAVNSSKGYFKFDDHILINLQLNYTKPVCIEEFFKLRSEIAQLIYSHIDLMLYDRSKYERRSQELFDDLGLKNPEYQHMYERKRAIEKALNELSGIRLSSGVLRSATISKTADGRDYKVSFTKGHASKAELVDEEDQSAGGIEHAPTPVVVLNDYSKAADPLFVAARNLVLKFYELFHRVDRHEPQSKEIGQASSLISQYGIERAEYIIDFAHAQAQATRYAPQTFGGILQYASRAVADFDAVNQPSKVLPAAESPRAIEASHSDRRRRHRGQARLAALTPDQYAAVAAEVSEHIRRAYPAMAGLLSGKATSIQSKIVSGWIVRRLDEEVMDLVAVGGNGDPAVIRQQLGFENLAL